MTRSIASAKAGSEPISGYVLRKRLGAGGYGEVWLADAPGGLQKAVKLIYGTVDESHASSELKSLQRIKQVYHPFLLSIERIEITEGQVAIVTELAESSLLDRFEQYRRRGSPGIPRAMLLDFLRDTADALDFLSQKHSLQHLDVKPGNLLIIADRIKVADFGLIKDLHDQNQSLVSGLTPTYSAPEIFDGRPDYRSDQYSLAILYTEMLTGRLPFSGSTTGELARQHISQAPDLESLPPADRPAVARALSKNPLDRFATCRQFVERLLKTKSAVVPVGSSNGQQQSREDMSTAAPVTASTIQARRSFMPRLDTSAIRNSWANSRSMFIGIGGVGSKALLELHKLLNSDCDNRLTTEDHRWLAIDTDIESLDELTQETSERPVLPSSVALQLPIYRPSEYRDAPPDLFTPLSRRWLYNIPRSQRTEGVRPLAILSFLDHYPQLRAKLSSELLELVKASRDDEISEEPVRVYVLSSLHGGTGSALMQEFGFLVRRIMAEIGHHNYQVIANVTAATTINGPRANLPAAAAMACLSELDYSMNRENECSSIYYEEMAAGSSNQTPFDWVTLVDGGLHGDSEECSSAINSLAALTWVDSQTMAGAALAESRRSFSASRHWLRTAAVSEINAATDVSKNTLARWCCEQSLAQSLRFLTGVRAGGEAIDLNQVIEEGNSPTVSGDLPLTEDACSDFLNRYLSEARVCQTVQPIDDGEGDVSELSAAVESWKRRLSESAEERSEQLRADFFVWQKAVLKLLKVQIYHWHQIERLQISCIQELLDRIAAGTLLNETAVSRIADQIQNPQQLNEHASDYMKTLAQQCLKFFDHFQKVGKDLTERAKSWCESINAEQSLNENSNEFSYQMLTPELQTLTVRINSVLGASLTRMIADSVAGVSANEEEINLAYLLKLSQEILEQNKAEMNVSVKDFTTNINGSDESRTLNDLEDFAPDISSIGGNVYRLVVSPQEQLQLVENALENDGIAKTTTVIAGTRSMGVYAFSDANGIAMHSLVGALWRPSVQTLQLAERVRTRVDVEWTPAAELLEVTLDGTPFVMNCDNSAALGEDTSVVSTPINIDPAMGSPGTESLQ